MERFLRASGSCFTCRTLRITLALLWISGLIVGSFLGIHAWEYLSVVDHIYTYSGGCEFLLVFLFRILPLLFCALSFSLSQPIILFITVFLRAFLFSLAVAGFCFTSGSSAWLLTVFMFLGDALILSTCWFLLLSYFVKSCFIRQAVLISLATIVAISFFDYLYIAPFMAQLI